MKTLALSAALLIGSVAFAQPLPPYPITVSGYVLGCTPGSTVSMVAVQGTQPAVNMSIPLDPNCGFSVDLMMDSYQGWFQFGTPCNGAMQQTTATYTVNALFPDSNVVYVFMDCSNTVVDCEGVVNGPAVPGTPCDDGDPNTLGDAWTANCMCAGGPTLPCEACFTASQASTPALGDIPFTAYLANCSNGGVAPYTYAWSLDGGVTYSGTTADLTVVLDPGNYMICLLMTSADGCTSSVCDSVVVDADGVVDPEPVNNTCQAAFFAMQAYQWVDSAANPNGGGGDPIPNQLWLWNLSTGTGSYQYVWSWGDGSSSAGAYPTHTYAGSGTYTICLTMAGSGCTDTYCQDITVDDEGILGGFMGAGNRSTFTVNVMDPLALAVTELPTLTGLDLWPNPVHDVLNIGLDSRIHGNLRFRINDLSGRMVLEGTHSITDGRNNLTIPVSALSAGSYLVTIQNGSTVMDQRFVKLR